MLKPVEFTGLQFSLRESSHGSSLEPRVSGAWRLATRG